MERYSNRRGNSPITHFQIEDERIVVWFKGGKSYSYSYLLSHDNLFNPKLGDLKAFWADIKELETIFYCQEPTCKRPKVSMKNYDNVAKKI